MNNIYLNINNMDPRLRAKLKIPIIKNDKDETDVLKDVINEV